MESRHFLHSHHRAIIFEVDKPRCIELELKLSSVTPASECQLTQQDNVQPYDEVWRTLYVRQPRGFNECSITTVAGEGKKDGCTATDRTANTDAHAPTVCREAEFFQQTWSNRRKSSPSIPDGIDDYIMLWTEIQQANRRLYSAKFRWELMAEHVVWHITLLNHAANIRIINETSKGKSLFLQIGLAAVVDDGEQYGLMAASGALDADETALISTKW